MPKWGQTPFFSVRNSKPAAFDGAAARKVALQPQEARGEKDFLPLQLDRAGALRPLALYCSRRVINSFTISGCLL